jgi:hypothetical protein
MILDIGKLNLLGLLGCFPPSGGINEIIEKIGIVRKRVKGGKRD